MDCCPASMVDFIWFTDDKLLKFYHCSHNKKSPANAKGNAQQQCVFESSVQPTSKLNHPSNNVSFALARGRQTTQPVSLSHIGLKSQIFLTPVYFNALAWGDLLRIYGKALRFLKLESFRQLTVILACTVFD